MGERRFADLQPLDHIVWNGADHGYATVMNNTGSGNVGITWTTDGESHTTVLRWRPDDRVALADDQGGE